MRTVAILVRRAAGFRRHNNNSKPVVLPLEIAWLCGSERLERLTTNINIDSLSCVEPAPIEPRFGPRKPTSKRIKEDCSNFVHTRYRMPLHIAAASDVFQPPISSVKIHIASSGCRLQVRGANVLLSQLYWVAVLA